MNHYMQNPTDLKATKVSNGVFQLARADGVIFIARHDGKKTWELTARDGAILAATGRHLAEVKQRASIFALPGEEEGNTQETKVERQRRLKKEASARARQRKAERKVAAKAEVIAMEAEPADEGTDEVGTGEGTDEFEAFPEV